VWQQAGLCQQQQQQQWNSSSSTVGNFVPCLQLLLRSWPCTGDLAALFGSGVACAGRQALYLLSCSCYCMAIALLTKVQRLLFYLHQLALVSLLIGDSFGMV
jgi:hypothetical protein